VADRIEELRRRVAADPGSRLFAQLAEALRKDGELEEAVRVARAGLERHPSYPSARLTLGRALLDSGDPAAARGELEAAARGAPDNILASRLLGEALDTLGDLDAALKQMKATLLMAPSDLHVQACINAIEERLASRGDGSDGAAGAAARGAEPRRDHTKPMAAVRREGLPPQEAAPAEPGRVEEAEEDNEAPPPSIGIHIPGGPVGGIRAPSPPIPVTPGAKPEPGGGEATAGEGRAEETTLPAPTRVAKAAGPSEAEPATDLRESVPDGAEAEGPPTLPKVPPQFHEPLGGERAATPGPGGEPPLAADSAGEETDVAPTLPTSKAAESAGLDPSLPASAPPGVVTTAEAQAGASAERVRVEEAAATTEAASAPPAAPDEGAEPPAAPEDAVRPSAPPPEAPTDPIPPEAAEQTAQAEPSALEPADRSGAPLSSGTLAELYFQQGLLERALEVYRQVLREEPGNESARARLAEIRAEMEVSASGLPAATEDGEGDGEDREARRRVLERTIEKLEDLLATVRARGRPA